LCTEIIHGEEFVTQSGTSLQAFSRGIWMNSLKLLQEELSGESQRALTGTLQIPKFVCYSVFKFSTTNVFPPLVNKGTK